MIVFKTILKIINKIKGMLILYTVLLLSITLLNQTTNTNTINFEESKPNILIVNNDSQSSITKGLINFLEKHTNIKDIDVSNEEKINDAIFYRDVNYVLYLNKDFTNDLLQGKNPTIDYKSSGDYYSSYASMLIQNYIKTANIYKDYYSGNELIDKINNTVENDIEIELKTKLDTNTISSATRYFNFLNYAFLAGCVYCISMVLASLKEKNVYKRTIISSYDYKKYNRITIYSNFIVILFMYILYMILSFILFKDLMLSTNGLYFIINSFIYMLCTLSIGFLIGSITQNKTAIGGIINVVALGTSFLCGCFVPFEYMPDYVINISKFLPTYYFVSNNELIKTLEVFNFENIKPLLINFGIIILFSIGFIIITNIISNKKRKIG